MKHYLIVVDGGTEISSIGPFDTEADRDEAAIGLDIDQPGGNIFKASCEGELNVGVFTNVEYEDLMGRPR